MVTPIALATGGFFSPLLQVEEKPVPKTRRHLGAPDLLVGY